VREIVNTDSQDMLELSSAIALRYYNHFADGSASSGNYGFSIFINLSATSRETELGLLASSLSLYRLSSSGTRIWRTEFLSMS
jgi:hypothetical protein